MQYYMSQLSSKQKIRIVNSAGDAVEAPLPPDFGFTFGSEYSTPFDSGGVSSTLQKLFALGRIQRPVGIRINKMYAGPEPAEISFEMEFSAFYDPLEEVIKPMVLLTIMGLGRVFDYDQVRKVIQSIGDAAGKVIDLVDVIPEEDVGAAARRSTSPAIERIEGAASEVDDILADEEVAKWGRLVSLFGILRAPPRCKIYFGDFITIDRAVITSTALSFSNVLNPEGYPMSGKVSVTCSVAKPPVADDVARFFSGPNVDFTNSASN